MAVSNTLFCVNSNFLPEHFINFASSNSFSHHCSKASFVVTVAFEKHPASLEADLQYLNLWNTKTNKQNQRLGKTILG